MLKKASICGVLATFALCGQAASAHTLVVGTCNSASATYTTVQSAVDAASNGDVVAVCPGTYAEQINITKSVSLRSVANMAAAQIVVPGGGLVQNTTTTDGMKTAAQILVAPATSGSANVTGLVVDAANNNNTDSNLNMVGIYYKGAGGQIARNTVKNQIGPAGTQGYQNGVGILVENATVGPDSVTIQNNDVSNFDKNGIVLRYPGSIGTVAHNTVTGLGPTSLLAQNGILIRDSASATVAGNHVSGFVYTPDTFGSAGIILFNLNPSLYQAPSVVQKNTVDTAQFGVVLDGASGVDGSNMMQVISNKLTNVVWDGVEMQSDSDLVPAVNSDYIYVLNNKVSNVTEYEGIDACGNNNTITKNSVTNANGVYAIHLDSLCQQANGDPSGFSNSVSGNHLNTACVGILSGPAQGQNTIGTNKFKVVNNQMIFGQDDYSCTAARVPHPGMTTKGKSKVRLRVSP